MYTRQSGAEVIKALEGNQENGLSSIQVEVRREKYGPNRLKERKEKGALQLFLEQLQDPLIYILMAAIAISLFLGEVGDAGIIAAVILTLLPELLRGMKDYRMLIYAIVLIIMMLFNWAPAARDWRARMVEKFKGKKAKKEVA